MATYRQITYRLPEAREDDFAAWLATQGSVGCSVEPGPLGVVRMTAYFAEEAQPPVGLATWEAAEETSGRLEDADWLAAYRATSVPFDVGALFRIDPGEPDDPGTVPEQNGSGGRSLLRIPARNAFGTGSHETTRLCVEWLEGLADRDGFGTWRILDVGTGSGILTFCAEVLGARHVAGYDLDSAAVLVARDNARRNTCRPALWSGPLESVSDSARFDLVLVNVLPERILDSYPALLARLHEGALIVSSGNLLERRDELLGRFSAMGLELEGEKSEGEWTSFLLRLVSPSGQDT